MINCDQNNGNLAPDPKTPTSPVPRTLPREAVTIRYRPRNLRRRKSVDPNLPGIGVRKIPKNPFSLTGKFSSVKEQPSQGFESTLERDLMHLLDADPTVKRFTAQPLRIEYEHKDKNGKVTVRHYTPDLLVEFVADPITESAPRAWLIEVKPRRILQKHKRAFMERFIAARRYAASNGWTFRILTENELRPKGLLANLKWLHPHLRRERDPRWEMAMLDTLSRPVEHTVATLLESVCPDPVLRPAALPTLWNLIGNRQIWADLQVPLGMDSLLKGANGPDPRFCWGPAGPPLRARLAPAQPQAMVSPMPTMPVISLAPGSHVNVRGNMGLILKATSMSEVLVRFEATGVRERIPIVDLEPFHPVASRRPTPPDLAAVDEKDLKEANRRAKLLRPLAWPHRTTRREIEAVGLALGVKVGTVYRWLNQFETSGHRASSLLPYKPTGGRGKGRLSQRDGGIGIVGLWTQVEKVIGEVIENYYLVSKKPSPTATAHEVRNRCIALGLPKPSMNTVRRRIAAIDDEITIRRRHGDDAADQTYRLARGSEFPPFPLAVVQVDHTKVDIELIDPVTGMAVGRPWITVIIDVFSRMVIGFHIGFEPPGNGPLGVCIRKALLGKEALLAKHGIKAEWPCWGQWETLHADNANEFRGEMIQRVADEYGFNLEWRPLKKKQYGGHIERLMGTLMKETHLLDGTTFSSIQKRGTYKPGENANFTIDDLELWLLHSIVGRYHNSPHRSLNGDTPLERYVKGIRGTDGAPGRGIPDRIPDSLRLRQDTIPFEWRTVQSEGIQWDGLRYFHSVLQTFRKDKDPANPEVSMEYLVRRDPDDISVIHLLDPKANEYHKIPTLYTGCRPGMTLADWKATKSASRAGLTVAQNEALRFEAYEAMRKVEEGARNRSKLACRNQERRRGSAARIAEAQECPVAADPSPAPTAIQMIHPIEDDDTAIVAFEDIQ